MNLEFFFFFFFEEKREVVFMEGGWGRRSWEICGNRSDTFNFFFFPSTKYHVQIKKEKKGSVEVAS